MNEGRVLKDGNTSYVCRLRWNGRDIVVKRYNHKGLVHSLRHTIKGSRARRGWLYGHRLGMLNIPTPKPLAYIEQRRGPIVWTSYLATEYIEGKNLYNFLADDSVAEQQRSRAIKRIEELLDKLDKHRIAHGDLKHSNILITAGRPILTDLDAMKVHRWKWTYRIRQRKDLLRLSTTKHPANHRPECS
jgi:tRNA A-37 threonylcarbamoyl transferase component Bud32